MQSLASRWDTPELRATIYQFTVYFPGGVASVFLGIWLFENGIQAEQIGFINAMPTLLLLILNVVVGRIADKADDWRTALIGLSIVSALAALPLFYVSEFWGILFVWALCASSNGLVPPVIDAATVRMTRRNGAQRHSSRSMLWWLFRARSWLFFCQGSVRLSLSSQLQR
jgi:PPP family 3-phenylpropionic acid transporter